jgi:hypothetical protein
MTQKNKIYKHITLVANMSTLERFLPASIQRGSPFNICSWCNQLTILHHLPLQMVLEKNLTNIMNFQFTKSSCCLPYCNC